MSPKPDVSEQRKEQILEAATTAFAKDGFSKTRMDDIAKESGLSKGSLYTYFKSKDEIFRGILDTFFQREFKLISRMAEEGAVPAREKLRRITEVILDDLEQMKFAMPIFFEFWAMTFRRKGVRGIFQAYLRNYISLIQPLFEEGIDSGEFRDLDGHQVAMAFGSLIEGSMVVWSYDPETIDLRELLSSNAEIFLDGLENDR